MKLQIPLNAVEGFFERFADDCHLVFGQEVVKRQRDGSLADGLGDGEPARLVMKALGDVGLGKDGREVVFCLNSALSHGLQDGVTLGASEIFSETDDKDKPAYVAAGRLCGDNQPVIAGEHYNLYTHLVESI